MDGTIRKYYDTRDSYGDAVTEGCRKFVECRDAFRTEMGKGLAEIFTHSLAVAAVIGSDWITVKDEESGEEFTLSSAMSGQIDIHFKSGFCTKGDITYIMSGNVYFCRIEGCQDRELDMDRNPIDNYEDAVKVASLLEVAVDSLNASKELYERVMRNADTIVTTLKERLENKTNGVVGYMEELSATMAKLNGETVAEEESGEMNITVSKHREGGNLRLVIEIGGLDNEN